MFENLIYLVIGFVGTLLGLEAAWHFTACKIPDDNEALYVQAGKGSSSELIADKKRIAYICQYREKEKKTEEVQAKNGRGGYCQLIC